MKAILFDIDGVIYNAEQPVLGAGEAVSLLQARGIPHRFLTNTSTRSQRDLAALLRRCGVTTVPEHIITPSVAAARWLADHQAQAVALFVTQSAAEEFEGLPLLPDDAESGADYVVVGDLGEAWSFRVLNRAFRLLHDNPNTTLVGLGLSRYWQGADGLLLDVAPFIAALENAVERRAVVLGKPAPAFFQAALDDLAISAGEAIMVGDDIRSDIGAAQRLGIPGILVRTGKYRPGDLQRGIIPDAVLDSIADLPQWWERHGS